ncbi:hypothetical protein [Enterococcus sp. AZ007]|uniref:hypothetical protein n=1 Tax=Enterococcus sp. AZ007 TaxID=2774839 RepID=UPI003F273D38
MELAEKQLGMNNYSILRTLLLRAFEMQGERLLEYERTAISELLYSITKEEIDICLKRSDQYEFNDFESYTEVFAVFQEVFNLDRYKELKEHFYEQTAEYFLDNKDKFSKKLKGYKDHDGKSVYDKKSKMYYPCSGTKHWDTLLRIIDENYQSQKETLSEADFNLFILENFKFYDTLIPVGYYLD